MRAKNDNAVRKELVNYLSELSDNSSMKEFFQLIDCVSYVTGRKLFTVKGGIATFDYDVSEVELAYIKQTVNELKRLKDLYKQTGE